mmetsp:Transcript_39213/g.81386  ORF Transcript_39213/g.81386 Transcript_39213/m.81386 type:complete len:81 (+) Transcript_39213:1010-1252(+)
MAFLNKKAVDMMWNSRPIYFVDCSFYQSFLFLENEVYGRIPKQYEKKYFAIVCTIRSLQDCVVNLPNGLEERSSHLDRRF